jgi:hypothetical protein
MILPAIVPEKGNTHLHAVFIAVQIVGLIRTNVERIVVKWTAVTINEDHCRCIESVTLRIDPAECTGVWSQVVHEGIFGVAVDACQIPSATQCLACLSSELLRLEGLEVLVKMLAKDSERYNSNDQ